MYFFKSYLVHAVHWSHFNRPGWTGPLNITPSEFADYIIAESTDNGPHNLDRHFAPQYSVCPFCRLHFDVIAKVENLNRDMNYILDFAAGQTRVSLE